MGATRQKKTEGGQGGKRGHSNMAHWFSTGEIKTSTRILRRRAARAEVNAQLDDIVTQDKVGAADGSHKPKSA
jgi:hypothetical protein